MALLCEFLQGGHVAEERLPSDSWRGPDHGEGLEGVQEVLYSVGT